METMRLKCVLGYEKMQLNQLLTRKRIDFREQPNIFFSAYIAYIYIYILAGLSRLLVESKYNNRLRNPLSFIKKTTFPILLHYFCHSFHYYFFIGFLIKENINFLVLA